MFEELLRLCQCFACTCVWSAAIQSSLLHSERGDAAGEGKAPRLNIEVWVSSVSCQRWQQHKWDPRREGEQKDWKRIYSSAVGGNGLCRRWSDDDRLCSRLKWNMTARELCAISCLAQEAPIWSWVLSVLCCCVVCCCNSSCRCCCNTVIMSEALHGPANGNGRREEFVI